MRLIDLYYRAFKEYRKKTKDVQEAVKARNVIKKANANNDILTTIKYRCEIEDDWIKNIEHGLIFIEKAIKEDRQFIRTEGDVVQIEKVRRVSRESVEHLSRNSNLITKVPKEGDMLIPEKLYVVEKLTDYAVYENRFLYLLLTYLEEFIRSRLEKIEKKVTTYYADIKLNKTFNINHRHVQFQLNLVNENEKDPFLVEYAKTTPNFNRIENILYGVRALLNTPLMLEVAKAPMIRLPIVKTNVLRMNPNFRAALELYDYITSYNKDGYSFEVVKKTYSPFDDNMGDQFAEAIELSTFLSYQHGNEISEYLEEVYQVEEERLDQEYVALMKEEIRRLKKRVREMNTDYEQYILLLEKRVIDLEKKQDEYVVIKQQNELLNAQVQQLEDENGRMNEEIDSLHLTIDNKDEEIQYLNDKYFRDMTALEADHREQIVRLKEAHKEEIEQLNEQHRNEIIALKQEHEETINQLVTQFKEEKESIIDRYERLKADLETRIEQLNDTIAALNAEKLEIIQTNERTIAELNEQHHAAINHLKVEMDGVIDERNYFRGLIFAMKNKEGLIENDEDFTSREKFNELLAIKKSFNKFFREQWKQTKQKIREEVRQESKKLLEEELKEKKQKKRKMKR